MVILGIAVKKTSKISFFSAAIDCLVDVAMTQFITFVYHLLGSILLHPPDASFWQEVQDV